MGWEKEHKDRAITLAKEGYAASKIAAILEHEFGIKKSRNACIGVVYRAGANLFGGGSLSSKRAGRKVAATRRYHRQKLESTFNKFRPAPSPVRAILCDGLPLPPPGATDVARVSFKDLEDRQCRWIPAHLDPKGHPQNRPLYCGEKTAAGTDYCTDHVKRLYSSPPVRNPPTTPAREWVREKGGGYTDTNRSRTLMKVN